MLQNMKLTTIVIMYYMFTFHLTMNHDVIASVILTTFQTSEILYCTYDDFKKFYDRRAANRLHLPSGLRGGFTHEPIGAIEGMTVTHSFINVTGWFLRGMAISESR